MRHLCQHTNSITNAKLAPATGMYKALDTLETSWFSGTNSQPVGIERGDRM
jgi:hypothetical protein